MMGAGSHMFAKIIDRGVELKLFKTCVYMFILINPRNMLINKRIAINIDKILIIIRSN